MSKKILIHIGFPKTGTTALQHAVFAKRAELLTAGVEYPDVGLVVEECAHHNLARAFTLDKARSVLFDPSLGDFESLIAHAARTSDHLLLSSEGLWATLRRPETRGRTLSYLTRLGEHAEVSILVCCRNAASYRESEYFQYARNRIPQRTFTAAVDRAMTNVTQFAQSVAELDGVVKGRIYTLPYSFQINDHIGKLISEHFGIAPLQLEATQRNDSLPAFVRYAIAAADPAAFGGDLSSYKRYKSRARRMQLRNVPRLSFISAKRHQALRQESIAMYRSLCDQYSTCQLEHEEAFAADVPALHLDDAPELQREFEAGLKQLQTFHTASGPVN